MSLENPNTGEDVNALEGIMSTYHSEIADNTILLAELARLKDFLEHSGQHSLKERVQVFDHILEELQENSGDHLRMTEESPQLDHHEVEANRHLDEQETLRDALNRFGSRYLN
ncbi:MULTISPECIES: hypothetical protein [unclassified Pseudovibrio]|uniref:hypothetical protein n=1 Tax=unclassified Pseudovibrio TaxID=2627060 RepID=UPI0007AE3F77|nr:MULTISPECIES: hypothetical protein [unclassified Pseudovibrio]KZK94522.1 hypothetical protein PsW74_04527 [Pseudovibrio sp. W74]KZL06922.1 hypothetical protein PsAD14_04387 [Pseudovibrio sp. Ad14]